MITRVSSLSALAWPAGWEDAEVVDSVLVEEPPALEASAAAPAAGRYDRFGRVPAEQRCGRLVSVLA